MDELEILERLRELAPAERLHFAEALLSQVRAELGASRDSHQQAAANRLADAARQLLRDYSQDKELTAFTNLDSEPFHA